MTIRWLTASTRAKTLKQLPLFAGCTTRELEGIASVTTELRLPAGDLLTVARRPGSEFFVIVTGTAEVWCNGVLLERAGPGSFFGELALLDGGARTATVVAETDLRVLVLTRREFTSAQFFIPPVTERLLATLSERLRRAHVRWADVVAAPAPAPAEAELDHALAG